MENVRWNDSLERFRTASVRWPQAFVRWLLASVRFPPQFIRFLVSFVRMPLANERMLVGKSQANRGVRLENRDFGSEQRHVEVAAGRAKVSRCRDTGSRAFACMTEIRIVVAGSGRLWTT